MDAFDFQIAVAFAPEYVRQPIRHYLRSWPSELERPLVFCGYSDAASFVARSTHDGVLQVA